MLELQREVSLLRADLDRSRTAEAQSLRSKPASARVVQTGSPDELARNIMVQVGTMVSARLEAIEERLLPPKPLRPPLAASRAPATVASTSAAKTPLAKVTTLMPPANPARTNGPMASKAKGKGKGKGKTARVPEPRPLPPAPTHMTEGWNVVTKKGKKKGVPKVNKEGLRRNVKPASKPPKLRQPRSAVISLKLQPGAANKEVTYKDVLTQIKDNVVLEDLGIKDVRYRVASTGARLLELPGAKTGDQADILAQKLRDVLSAEVVQVSRPTRCAELRVSGLDDSVSSEEVAMAVSRAGGCEAGAIKVGEIRQDRQGLGTAWVRCPVSAAKRVSGGRLLVGFVSARVQLLQPRVLRCFRCHEVGHVAAKCKSATDRSAHCFRCGMPGHKQHDCSAPAHCPICKEANRPANHLAGGAVCAKVCARSTKRGGGGRGSARQTAQSRSEAPVQGEELQNMEH